MPEQDEDSILDTIRFNRLLQPDNMTVAFYSPYIGTAQQKRGKELGYFDDYEYHVDSALRSLSQHSLVDVEKLQFYKKNFVNFVNNGIPKGYEIIEFEVIETYFKVVIGTWPLSGDLGHVDREKAYKILEYCAKVGFTEFDTAPNYGNGFMESCLGEVFGDDDRILINTKCGNSVHNVKNFDKTALEQSLIHSSLGRLKRDSVHGLFLHNPRSEIDDYEPVLDLFNKEKNIGRITYSGLSAAKNYKYEPSQYKHVDLLQDDVNLLFIDGMLNSKTKNHFYARSPLATGILSGRITNETTFPSNDYRSTCTKR